MKPENNNPPPPPEHDTGHPDDGGGGGGAPVRWILHAELQKWCCVTPTRGELGDDEIAMDVDAVVLGGGRVVGRRVGPVSFKAGTDLAGPGTVLSVPVDPTHRGVNFRWMLEEVDLLGKAPANAAPLLPAPWNLYNDPFLFVGHQVALVWAGGVPTWTVTVPGKVHPPVAGAGFVRGTPYTNPPLPAPNFLGGAVTGGAYAVQISYWMQQVPAAQ